MIGVGIIGYGYWGPNLVRNFYEQAGCKVVAVSDLRQSQLEKVRARYPTIETTTDYRDLLRNPQIDAVAIATPVSTHFALGMEALRAGKHVLVEKPMTLDVDQATRLVDEADLRRRILAVDIHTVGGPVTLVLLVATRLPSRERIAVPAVEKRDGRAVPDREPVVQPAHLGVLPRDHLVDADPVVVAALWVGGRRKSPYRPKREWIGVEMENPGEE